MYGTGTRFGPLNPGDKIAGFGVIEKNPHGLPYPVDKDGNVLCGCARIGESLFDVITGVLLTPEDVAKRTNNLVFSYIGIAHLSKIIHDIQVGV